MMKSILAIAVLSSALALEAARPVAETERMMKDNAYQGVWLETHHDEALKVAFSTNGWMIVDYRGCPQLFRWKSNGKGLVELAPGEKPEKTVMKLKYLPKQDIMDCGFEGKTTQLDFTGRLAFKSTELAAEHAEALREATARHERYREERFERLKMSGDPRLRCVENLKNILDPDWLVRNTVWAETVDLEYPRIVIGDVMTDDFMVMDLYYGAYESKRIALHEIDNGDWHKIEYKLPQKENNIGIPRARVKMALQELLEAGVKTKMFCRYFGEGEWWEEAFTCYVHRKDRGKVAEVFSRYFAGDHSRYVWVDKAKYIEENNEMPEPNAKANMGVKW